MHCARTRRTQHTSAEAACVDTPVPPAPHLPGRRLTCSPTPALVVLYLQALTIPAAAHAVHGRASVHARRSDSGTFARAHYRGGPPPAPMHVQARAEGICER